MGYDRAIQVIEHRTFLQPQGLYHGQHPLHEPTPRRAVATKGILAPQHAQAEDAFHMVVRGLDTFDRREQPQRRIQCQEIVKRSPPWNPRRSNLAPKHLGVRVQSDPTGLAAPVGPVRRGGTPTSRRTGIPRHPDPPGQLLQRVLLDRPASESRVSGGPNRFGAGSAAACCRPTSGRYRRCRDRLAQQSLKAREISPEVNHEKGHCRGRRASRASVCPPSPSNWSRPCSSPGPHGPPPEPLDTDWPRQHSSSPSRRGDRAQGGRHLEDRPDDLFHTPSADVMTAAQVRHHRGQAWPDDIGANLRGISLRLRWPQQGQVRACPWYSVMLAANSGSSAT